MVRDDLPTQAAALAYCASLSVAPIIVLLFSLTSWIGLDLNSELARQTHELLGPNAASAVIATIETARGSRLPLRTAGHLIGAITLLLSASVVVAQMHSTLNIIFGPADYASQVKAYFKQRGLSLLIVLAGIVLGVITLSASAFLHATTDRRLEQWGLPLEFTFTLVTFTGVFALLYRFVPDCPPSWWSAVRGAALTSVLFLLGKTPLASFLGRSVSPDIYGAAGSIVLFLLWVYYSSVIIYLGAELSAYLDSKQPLTKGEQVWSH